MNELVQTRALVHRGTIEAWALFFDVALLGEAQTRQRVLQNWSSGAQVYEVAGGYLLRLATPLRLNCNVAPSLPLTEEKGLLLAAPLTEDERRVLEITSESLVILRGGAAQVFSLAGLKSIDVSTWLDVNHFQTLPMISLGEVPSAPPLLVQENTFDVREKLGVEASPELAKLLAQMREDAPKKEDEGSNFSRLVAAFSNLWQNLTAPRNLTRKPAETIIENEILGRKPSFLAVVLALLQVGAIALVTLLVMSLPLSEIDFSAIIYALITGLVLYAVVLVLWRFWLWIFVQKNVLGENQSRWICFIGGAIFAAMLLISSTGNGFDWVAFSTKFVTFLLIVLAGLFFGALVIGVLIWAARQFEKSAKTPKKVAAPVVNDLPLPWIIGGVLIGLAKVITHDSAILNFLIGFLFLGALIYGILSPKKAPAKTSSNTAPKKASATTSLMPPEPVEGPFAALRNALARAAWMAGLWRIYGPIQARYIARLMDMFARGDLDNALRHAIPMGGATSGKATPAFGLPIPRGLLEIFTGRRISASVLPMPPDIAEQLRQQYRAAFERLDAQGKHEEAAFVLAELLHASAEAVAYLERQNRLRLAAELAESRDLLPDLIVRQWLVAGETERAIWIARRKNAFSAAITRLENGSPADKLNAQKLRLLWANELARGGDFVAAVSAAWPVIEARNLANEWIKRGLLLGGLAKARMLAWRCQISTSLEPELRDLVLEFLSEPGGAEARLTFAKGLNEGMQTPVVKTLARATTRALVRDTNSNAFNEVRKAACQKLIEISGDGALRADVPPRLFVSSGKPLKDREQQVKIVIETADTGALPLYDAAYLPDGRTIVALGEAGARLLSRDGRTIAHFDQPCHRLVLSDNGDRALALAPRGEATRIAKLDFATRRAVSWCETRLDVCAFSYDGSLWFLACDGSIFAVDTTSQKFGALWHTPGVGEVACIERSPHSCAFLTRFIARENFGFRSREKWERWQLEVPSLILRQRTVIPDWSLVIDDGIRHETFFNSVTPDGSWARLTGGLDRPIMLTPNNVEITNLGETIYSLSGALDWWVAIVSSAIGIQCFLLDRGAYKERLWLGLNGAQHAQARFSGNHLTLCDERGRLLIFDLECGALTHSFRVS